MDIWISISSPLRFKADGSHELISIKRPLWKVIGPNGVWNEPANVSEHERYDDEFVEMPEHQDEIWNDIDRADYIDR
jgi:hypothetical protein